MKAGKNNFKNELKKKGTAALIIKLFSAATPFNEKLYIPLKIP